MNFTSRREFSASVTNNKGVKFRYICTKKGTAINTKNTGYFLAERYGWANMKMLQVSRNATSMDWSQ